jgi:hypothetical protein
MTTRSLIAASIALALAACGGGSGGTMPATPPVVAPPAVTLDAFFKTVQGAIGIAPDDKEPADIGAVAVTEPDTAEPEKVD